MKKTSMALFYIVASIAFGKIPEWASKNSTKLTGKTLVTICSGTGPSLEIARGEALSSCQSNAGQFFKSKIRIKSLTVETEKAVGFHQEITNADEIEGLICDPQRDQIDELDSQFTVWLECKFNLDKAKSKPLPDVTNSIISDSLNLSYSKPSIVKSYTPNKIIFLSTVPKCDSIIIKGSRPRTVPCKNNPVELEISDADINAIIRVSDFKPKTIELIDRSNNEIIQILLEK